MSAIPMLRRLRQEDVYPMCRGEDADGHRDGDGSALQIPGKSRRGEGREVASPS